MARRSHQALSAAVAGACLTLCACGTTSAPSAAGSPAASTTGAATATGSASKHFCADASSFMQHIPAGPTTKHTTAAEARANLRTVLLATVKGFSALETEAPRKLHKPLKTIVGIYKADVKVLKRSGSLAQISQSMVKGNASGSLAFQRVLKYISVDCK
jgi:hypothetical protein